MPEPTQHSAPLTEDDWKRVMPKGWPDHRYVYSTEDGDSCTCGWTPSGLRITDQGEWDAHVTDS